MISATFGEQPHFPNSVLPSRRPLRWPGGAAIALTIFLHFEAVDIDPPRGTVADPRWRERATPDVRLLSFHEYGHRVAIFRVLDLLDRLDLKVTVAGNALAFERYPYLVEAFRRRGYDLAARGPSANFMLSSALTRDAERAAIADTLTRIQAATGLKPVGWVGQDFGESTNTPALLAQAGLRYVSDWPNDDQPFAMTGAEGLVSVPVPYELDDMRLFIERRLQAWHFPPMLHAALDRLAEEGTEQGRCMPLSIHPWVFGAPHRIRYLEEALTAASRRPDIWPATAADVAAHYAASLRPVENT